jgi:flagellar basal-body rod modification protein FlgD
MNVYAYSAANGSNGTTGTSLTNQTSDMFLQLLMAQLKSQSPLDPVDPNQFVGQLVQFNTLSQIIGIHDLLQQVVGATATATSSNTGE